MHQQLNPRKHARPEQRVLVGHEGSDQNGSASGVHQWADCIDLTGSGLARQGIKLQFNALAQLHFADIQLRQAEIRLQQTNRLQRRQILASTDVVTNRYGSQTHDALEGCRDHCFVQPRLGQLHCRLLNFQRIRSLIAKLLGYVAFSVQAGGTVALALRERQIGLDLLKFGTSDRVVEPEQHLTLCDGTALFEIDFLDPTDHLGAQHHRLFGAQAAYRGQTTGKRNCFNDCRFDYHCTRRSSCRRSRCCWRA